MAVKPLSSTSSHSIQIISHDTVYSGGLEKGVCTWKGIPYAKSTAGEGRFRPPQIPEKVDEIVADQFGPACPQHKHLNVPKNENCLNLNIWARFGAKRRPVLFYIHGGSFMSGTGSDPVFDGQELVEAENIVVVTINYRLGVLGILDFSFLDDRFTPNCAILDVCMALRWTYEHIADFGGNPDNITVMGESAGGSIVSLLPAIPEAAQYISKCVISSGVPTEFWTKSQAQQMAQGYMKFMGISSAEELLAISAERIGDSTQDFTQYTKLGAASYEPSVDGEIIRDFPLVSVQQAEFKKIPMWIGMTRDEMSFLTFSILSRRWGLAKLIEEGTDEESAALREKIIRIYDETYDKDEARIQLYSDMVIRAPLIWYAEEASQTTHVWLYRMDWSSRIMDKLGIKAFHSSDLPFFFGNFNFPANRIYYQGKEEKKIVKAIEHSIQRDLATFMDSGTLPWETAREGYIGKCYGDEICYEVIMPEEIRDYWRQTTYHERSFISAWQSNNTGTNQ